MHWRVCVRERGRKTESENKRDVNLPKNFFYYLHINTF